MCEQQHTGRIRVRRSEGPAQVTEAVDDDALWRNTDSFFADTCDDVRGARYRIVVG
jgi:hypothetical protein